MAHLWEIDEVFALFRQAHSDVGRLPITPFETQILQLVTLRNSVTQEKPVSVSELLAHLEDLRLLWGSPRPLSCFLEVLVLEALTLDVSGRTNDALTTLERAFALAAPEDYVRIFVDYRMPMAKLLREAKARGIAVEYVTMLLAAFDHETPIKSPPPSEEWINGEFESLSNRELDVLRLIAEGTSNREVADQLVVSLGTVKKHLNNIFLKLDVHSRTQAIALAQKHKLL